MLSSEICRLKKWTAIVEARSLELGTAVDTLGSAGPIGLDERPSLEGLVRVEPSSVDETLNLLHVGPHDF